MFIDEPATGGARISRRAALAVPVAAVLPLAEVAAAPAQAVFGTSAPVAQARGEFRPPDGFVTPDQFRLDSEQDDHQAMQRAIAHSLRHNGRGIIGLGRIYQIGATDFHNVNMLTSTGVGNTVFRALPGSRDGENSAFIRYRNMSRCSWQQIQIDANNEFDIGLDTSWDATSGPSLNILYKMLLIRGFRKLGWLADNNNDVWNEQIIVLEPGAGAAPNPRSSTLPLVTAYRNRGPGGPIGFSGCNFLCGPVEAAGQNISLVQTVARGIRIPAGGGFNTIDVVGGHIFADEATGLNFDLNGRIASLSVRGTQLENSVPDGAIFGGSGAFVANAISLVGAHAFRSGEIAEKVRLCRKGVGTVGGGPVIVAWEGGQLDMVDVEQSGGWARFDGPGSCVNGSVVHPWQRRSFGRVAKTTAYGADGAASIQAQPDTGIISTGLASYVKTRGAEWATLVEVPTGSGAWIVAAAASDPDAPSTIAMLCRSGSVASGTTLHSSNDAVASAQAALEFRFADGGWQVRMSGGGHARTITWTLNISGSAAG